ncbi:MAG: STAS domain-containing protein [Rudaea sp.]
MALDIAQERQGAARVLVLRGRLDTDTAADMELALQDLLAAGERDFLIDLGGVIYVSSAGLRVLLALAKQLDGGKGSLRLCGLNPTVTQVFEVAGFSKLFAIFKDRATALAGAAKGVPAAQPPSLAQQLAQLLRVGDYTSPASAQARELARAAAQLLGVKPMLLPAAVPQSALPVITADFRQPRPQAQGLFARLRGLFGRN